MKNTILKLTGLLALLVTFAVTEANAQAVCFYEEANFRGRSFCLNENSLANDFVAYGMNDSVSSVYFYRPSQVTMCEHSFMGGRCINLNASTPDLMRFGFNDMASSAQVGYGGSYPQPPPPPPYNPQPQPPYNPNPGPIPPGFGGQVCLFEHSYYQGRSVCLNRGQQISDLSGHNFNDMASSIRTRGQARVMICSDNGFRGICRNVYESVPDFLQIGLNDTITSVRVD